MCKDYYRITHNCKIWKTSIRQYWNCYSNYRLFTQESTIQAFKKKNGGVYTEPGKMP